MSPAEQYERTELAGLQDSMRDIALIIEDRHMAEQVIRVAGAIVAVHDLHDVDARFRCLLCRPAGRRMLLRRRQPCTVRDVFETYRLTDPIRDGGPR
jgi:hypothetical protein